MPSTFKAILAAILLRLTQGDSHNDTSPVGAPYAPCPSCLVFAYDSWSPVIRQGSCRKLRIQDRGPAKHWATIRCKELDGRKAGDAMDVLDVAEVWEG